MAIRNLRKPNKLFKSILLSLTFSTIATILILSFILYFNFEKIGCNLIYSFSKDSLTQASFSADFMVRTAKMFSLQISNNANFAKLLYYPMLGASELKFPLEQFNNYRLSNISIIHSIYIYNKRADAFYTTVPTNAFCIQKTDVFFDQEIMQILNNINSYKHLKVIPRHIEVPYLNNSEKQPANIYSYVQGDNPNSGHYNSAIIINISEEWVRSLMDSLNTNPKNNTFIIDNTGNMVISNKNVEMLNNVSNQGYIKKILYTHNNSGFFIDDVDGIKSLVTYVTSGNLGWKFIRITPYENVVARINELKLTTVVICIFILVFGLSASYLISRKLYKPIDNILAKYSSLEKERQESLFTLKQNFLKEILLRSQNIDFRACHEKLRYYNVKLNSESPILLLHIQIDSFWDFYGRYNYKDRNIYKFAIMNITGELCGKYFVNEAIDAGENCIVIILGNLPEADSSVLDTLNILIESIKASILQYLNISVSLTVSPRGNSFRDMEIIYSQISEASNYRLFKGHSCTIYVEDLNQLKSNEYVYPMEKEQLLVDALMLGKTCEVKSIFHDILKSTSEYSFSLFNLTLYRLTSAIKIALDKLAGNGSLPSKLNISDFFTSINRFETIDDIQSYFYAVFENAAQYLKEKRSTKNDDLIDRMVTVICENYNDSNLSMQTIADHLGMSAKYLGRLVKKMTDKSVADFINEYRIEKAKILMKNTNMSISEIAENIGMLNKPYFYTIFRKIHGNTPNEYRQNHSK